MDPITAGLVAQGAIGTVGALGDLFGGRDDEQVRRALNALQQTNAQANRTGAASEGLGQQQATMRALMSLYQQGGMDPQARAALAQANQATASQEQMQRQALVQNYAMRGMGGGGTQLAAQLANQQGAANRNNMAGTQVAGDARTRALQGLYQSANIGGQIRGQEDAFEQFNARQRLSKAQAMLGGATSAYGVKQDEDERRRQDLGNSAGMLGYGGAKAGWF